MQIVDFPTTTEFVKAAVAWITGIVLKAQGDTERVVTIGLSGGWTPQPVFSFLSTESAIRWENVLFFLTDERYVPTGSEQSNQTMIQRTLLTHSAASARTIFPNTALALPECRAKYDECLRGLRSFDSAQGLRPDIVLLGMGEDGHIASLFPPLPPEAFGPALVIHTTTDRFEVHDRLSVTLPVLLHASNRLFLIAGEKKKRLLKEMEHGNEDVSMYPAQYLFDDRTTWMVGP